MPIRPLIVFGTRPEAIKLAPLVTHCRRDGAFEPFVCNTGQHRELVDPIIDYFSLPIDADLHAMRSGQSLAELTGRILTGIESLHARHQFDCVVVQGDTTSAMAAALAAFYRRLPVVHVEAGLRTGDLSAPWPEEMNRRAISVMASLHCAPTDRAADALRAEGVPEETIHVTGNTVVDALLSTVARETAVESPWPHQFGLHDQTTRMVLITCHRRESFGDGIDRICTAIRRLAEQFPGVQFIYPVHRNPAVEGPMRARLDGLSNVLLTPPAAYPAFVWLMQRSTLILTDSGGVQEEAPSLRKPVVVMRDCTERQEAVDAGAVALVGTDVAAITGTVAKLLTDERAYAAMQVQENPYGDGTAAERIAQLMLAFCGGRA